MNSYVKSILDFDKTIAKDYILEKEQPWLVIADLANIIKEIGKNLDKENWLELDENVWVHKSVKIDPLTRIIGPCIIDEGTEIRVGTLIRDNVIIGKNCTIGNASYLRNAILFDNVEIAHYNHVGNSILGYKSHMGACATISNLKSDKSCVKVVLDGKLYETNQKKLGALVGDFVEIGCNAVLTPGVVVGNNSNIYPLTMVRGEIKSNKIVKSMDNIVEKR